MILYEVYSKFFQGVLNLRKSIYSQIIKPIQVKPFVISVGNIIAGGTGKTPITLYLTNLLLSENLRIGIVGKGYKRTIKKDCLVRDSSKIYANIDEAGDELLMLAEKLNVPILACDSKSRGVSILSNNYDLDIIIVDDAFQHLKLFRNLDIVIINSNTFNEKYLIPFGSLREKITAISRADIILTRNLENEQIDSLKFLNNNIFTLNSRLFIPELDNIKSQKVLSLSALANNNNFIKLLNENGINIASSIFYSDHYNYKEKDIHKIINKCKSLDIYNILTTEKDYVKIKQFLNLISESKINILVCELELKPNNEFEFKNIILQHYEKHN